jgi:hypothetical protein
MSSTTICRVCRGSGHDKAGMPVIKKQRVAQSRGAFVMVTHNHVTLKQGSGCLKCCGRGIISLNGGW